MSTMTKPKVEETEESSSFMNRIFAAILAITGIFLFSSKAVLVKMAYEFHVDSVTLLLLRMGFALPIFLIIGIVNAYRIPQAQKIDKQGVLTIIALGFVGYYLASFLDFRGLQYISASLERLILFVYPTLVVMISAIFLKKKITKRQFMAIGMTYFGMVVIFSNFFFEKQTISIENIIIGGILIFLSALTYAIYLIGSGEVIPKIGTVRFTTYAMLVSCVCVIIHYFASNDNYMLVLEQPTKVYVLGFIMAVFATVIPSYLISEAIRRIGASTVSILGSLGPVSTIGLSMIYLGESLTLNQIIGAVLVIAGVFLVSKKV